MARHEDVERFRAQKEQALAVKREELVDQFGLDLGGALFTYAFAEVPSTEEEAGERRERFAQVLQSFINSDRQYQIKGILAILEAFEAKIAPVAYQAAEADLTRPIR